jgi:hypothetical protein
MIELMWLSLIPAYYFMNRQRGRMGAGGAIFGAATGFIVFAATLDPIAAVICGALYFAGESVGWGRWLRTVPHWGRTSTDDYWANVRQPERGKIIHKIANSISKEKKDFAKYAQTALYIRAAIWFPPILTALAVTGHANPLVAAVASVAAVVAFPWAYWAAARSARREWWGRGERYYGAVQGACLAAALISG